MYVCYVVVIYCVKDHGGRVVVRVWIGKVSVISTYDIKRVIVLCDRGIVNPSRKFVACNKREADSVGNSIQCN